MVELFGEIGKCTYNFGGKGKSTIYYNFGGNRIHITIYSIMVDIFLRQIFHE